MVLPEFVRIGENPTQGSFGMTFVAAHSDSHARHSAADVNQAAFASSRRLSDRVQGLDHRNARTVIERKHIYKRKNIFVLWCLLFLMSSALTLAQSGTHNPTSLVPLISVDTCAVSGTHFREMEYRSVRDGDTQFPVDKLAPKGQGVSLSTNTAVNRAKRQWQAEWTTGSQLAAKIEQDTTVIEDPNLTAYVNSLELTIVKRSDLQGCFLVKILDDPEANAFSLPGGFLYVTTGLLLVADSEGELTAALAHETGHVTARHFAKIEQKRRVWGRVALAGGPVGYLARRLFGPLLTRKLIRNSEFEADQLSLQYQSASGYDPGEFSRLLKNAFQDQGKAPSFVERLLNTHPLTSTRIKRLDKVRRRLPPGTTNQPIDTSRFLHVKERLAALLKVPGSSLPKADPKADP